MVNGHNILCKTLGGVKDRKRRADKEQEIKGRQGR
jgi:hypothetical protein